MLGVESWFLVYFDSLLKSWVSISGFLLSKSWEKISDKIFLNSNQITVFNDKNSNFPEVGILDSKLLDSILKLVRSIL
jgi:hypothetical protein